MFQSSNASVYGLLKWNGFFSLPKDDHEADGSLLCRSSVAHRYLESALTHIVHITSNERSQSLVLRAMASDVPQQSFG